jgi:hypothetical protein
MWRLLPWSKQVVVVVALAVLLAWALDGLFELLQGHRAPLLKFISLFAMVITIGVAGVAAAIWRYVWQKFPFLARKIFPDLTGTWEGNLVSTWIDPSTYQRLPPIRATLTVRQGLFSMSIKLRTEELTSYSTRFVLESDPDAGRFRIWYSYDDRPRAELAFRSARHEGVGWLEMEIDSDPDRMVGQYYTDRQTTGDMTFSRVSRDVIARAPPGGKPAN